MRRELPNRPHLDHLKAQAKELLDGHRRRDPAALERIRAALPAYTNASHDAIAEHPLALHDSQSTIAREYGFSTWAALRTHVLAVRETPDPVEFVESLFAARLTEPLRDAYREAWSKSQADDVSELATPEILPLIAARNALVSPGALVPLMIGRPASIAALSQATADEPALVAVFAQRTEATEKPDLDDLHPVGCLAVVRRFQPNDGATAWVVLEGVRWIGLAELVAVDPYYIARVTPLDVPEGDAAEVQALSAELRSGAQKLAESLGDQRDAAVAMLERIDDPSRLSDLVVANLPCTVAEKAAYAGEPTLATRLRAAIGLVQRALGTDVRD